MVKKCIKIIGICLIFLLIINIITNQNICLATSIDITENVEDWTHITVQDTGDTFSGLVNTVVSIVRTVGILVSVIALSLIGIKYMLGSVEEKANYKQKLIPWVTGAVMVFAITFIPTIIYDMTLSAIGTREQQATIGSYMEGYNYAIERLYEKYHQTSTYLSHSKIVEELAWMKEETEFTKGYKNFVTSVSSKINAINNGYSDEYNSNSILESAYEIYEKVKNGDIVEENFVEHYIESLRTIYTLNENATAIYNNRYSIKIMVLNTYMENYWPDQEQHLKDDEINNYCMGLDDAYRTAVYMEESGNVKIYDRHQMNCGRATGYQEGYMDGMEFYGAVSLDSMLQEINKIKKEKGMGSN